jgi:phospholipase C
VYAVSGTIDPAGLGGGPVVSNAQPNGLFTFPTYYERLQAAGITWRDYATSQFGGELPFTFAQFANADPGSPLYENGVRIRSLSALMDDVLHDRLPQFSRIESSFPPEVDEHPPSLPALGAGFIYSILDALASNPEVWAKTVLFITYDENDGFFDHVPLPPHRPAPTASGSLRRCPMTPAASPDRSAWDSGSPCWSSPRGAGAAGSPARPSITPRSSASPRNCSASASPRSAAGGAAPSAT